MRLRNIPGAWEEMLENQYVIQEPATLKGRWSEEITGGRPLHLEIGMGKGQFLTTLAQQNPDIFYLGVEKFASVLIRAVEKQEQLDLPNLRFLRFDADAITEVFEPGEVDRLYLNFSDPWPKDRHAKRRLTSSRFLARYRQILKPDGVVAFKTDNRPLFDFSVEELLASGWTLSKVTYDLHHSEYAEGNVMTEYEERFSQKGNPICRLEATCPVE